MTNPISERTRPFARSALVILAAASVAALCLLVLAAPGGAQLGTIFDAPPRTDPTGPNPLGAPTVERATAPMDEQGPSESVAAGRTVALPDGTEAVAGELIVNYENGVATRQSDLRRQAGATLKTDFPEIDAEVVALDEAAGTAGELEAKKAEIEADPAVESVDYNYVVRAAWSPNDPYFRGGYQANVRAVDAPRAWERSRGGARVAVLDSGCYRGHVELNEGKVVAQTDKYYGDGIANDERGHGTHVSSILAADTNNGAGIAGGAPGAQILCAKVLSNSGTSTTDVVMDGMRWAKANGARVVNMSLGGASYQRSFAELTASMYRSGVFVVAGAGNDNRYRGAYYPAAYPGVMAVAGTERDGTGRYLTANGGSNWGPYVDIAAPGEGIWGASISGPDRYVMYSGTSMATPHVAAAGAILASRGARAPAIFKSLRATADDRGARGRDDVYGSGLVDYHGGLLHYQRSR